MPNEEKNIAIIDVPMDEFLVFNEVEACNHATLENLDAPDQHPIASVVGLEEELANIKSLKTVESDKKNSANYYKWSDGVSRPFGYFVTFVPDDLTITICDGSDIFGVTIEDAAFVGGQDALVPRDGTYGLVATFGVVDVRCEAEIKTGDYVVSDEYGIAKKATENCGYKVFATKTINNIDYVTISLGVQACTTNLLGTRIKSLDERVDAAEDNIADIRTDVSDAMSKIDNIILNNEATSGDLTGTIERVDSLAGAVDSIGGTINDLNSQAKTIQKTSEDAKRIADEAKGEANGVTLKLAELTTNVAPLTEWESEDGSQKGASYFVQYINDENVKTKADIETLSTTSTEHTSAILQNGKSIEMVVTSIDKYGIGEYSAAYGMTLEEAKTILKDGMIYIPLRNNGEDTHEEMYKTYDGEVGREFTYGFYYEWSKDSGWLEKIGEVWFGSEQPSGTTYDYWYDGNKLYVLSGEEWVEATTIAGNVNNRITSMIRQNVNSVAVEVASARGDAASLGARLDDTESQVGMVAKKTDPSTDEGKEHIAAIFATANEDGSNITLSADHIVLNGADTTFMDADGNMVKIHGGCIDADTLYVDAAHVTGEITANHMEAVSGSVGGFTIKDKQLYTGDKDSFDKTRTAGVYIGTDGISVGGILNSKPDLTTYYASVSLDASTGKLIANNAEITGMMTVTGGSIANVTITSDYGLTNNATWSAADWGIGSNTLLFGYNGLSVDDDGSLNPLDTSNIVMFGGNTGFNVSTNPSAANSTDMCNFYVTQSGFVSARNIYCQNGVIGAQTLIDNLGYYDICMHKGQLKVRYEALDESVVTAAYGAQQAIWSDGTTTGKIFADYTNDWMKLDGCSWAVTNKFFVAPDKETYGDIYTSHDVALTNGHLDVAKELAYLRYAVTQLINQ